MKVVAYIKASQDRAEIRKQRQVILEFARREQLSISRFIEIPIAAINNKNSNKRHRLFHHVEPGDTLIVSQLSDIGWSLGEIVKTVDMLVKKRVRFAVIKAGIFLNSGPSIESQAIAKVCGDNRESARGCGWIFLFQFFCSCAIILTPWLMGLAGASRQEVTVMKTGVGYDWVSEVIL